MNEAEHVVRTRNVDGDCAEWYAATIGTVISKQVEAPLDLALLGLFAESIRDSNGPVVDASCGTGHPFPLTVRGERTCHTQISPE